MPVRHSPLVTRHSSLDMSTRLRIAVLAALLVAAPALTRAQSRPPTPSPELAHAGFQQRVATAERAFRPCQSRPESHLFDFWIGEWDVTTPQGQPGGKSSVQQILSQCVIFENWTDRQGGQGKSFNAYNVDYNMWQQFWTDQYGRVTEYRESERTPEGWLRFLAHQRLAQGPSHIRMTFTPIDRNTVHQYGETSTDNGKTWTTSFDLYYHRKP